MTNYDNYVVEQLLLWTKWT